MSLTVRKGACAAIAGLLLTPAFAHADPSLPSFALAPVKLAEQAPSPAAQSVQQTGFDISLAPSFFAEGDLDIVEDPLYADNSEWAAAPGAGRSIAEMRESFETGDTPRITLTRFATD